MARGGERAGKKLRRNRRSGKSPRGREKEVVDLHKNFYRKYYWLISIYGMKRIWTSIVHLECIERERDEEEERRVMRTCCW